MEEKNKDARWAQRTERNTAPLVMVLLLAGLSALSGLLLSRASLVGRTGINLFYKEYRFLKIWWQGAAIVFAVLLVFFLLQGWANRRWKRTASMLLQSGLLVLAAAGLYFTYLDFTNTVSHRMLGERFHIGAYLFWISWMMICVYYLVTRPGPEVKSI